MKKFCLVGRDISYSLSPEIHKEIYRLLGEKADYRLEDVLPNDLPRVINLYDGLNVTKPYKLLIKQYLDSSLSLSVNTVIKQNGRSVGLSTDGEGFLASLKNTGGDKFSCVTVVGGGGAALAVADALTKKGIKTNVYARSYSEAREICRLTGAEPGKADYEPQAVVYCASAGAYLPFCRDRLEYLMDLRYDGSEITSKDFYTVNGLLMLTQQAVRSAFYFLSIPYDEKRIDEISQFIYNSLRSNKNQP